jgi:hypothetical protein
MGMCALEPSSKIYPSAKAAALKALELDDGLAEAHADLGLIKLGVRLGLVGGRTRA